MQYGNWRIYPREGIALQIKMELPFESLDHSELLALRDDLHCCIQEKYRIAHLDEVGKRRGGKNTLFSLHQLLIFSFFISTFIFN